MRFATQAIRVAQDPDLAHGAVINPIYQSTTFAWNSLDELPKFDYTRVANPNRHALEQVLAALEGARFCTVFSSGMAAVMATLCDLRVGETMLIADDIYGGTHRVAQNEMPRQGVQVRSFDSLRPESIREAAAQGAKLLIFESPTNPNLRLADIEATVAIAKELGVRTVFDNTFASPALQNPLALGVDVVLHSTTKYVSGHSDVVGGAVLTNDETIWANVFEYIKTVGSNPSPFDCWLSLRGVKTLAVRMKQHCENAMAVAKFLESHPRVSRVHYPGLPSHPQYELSKRQMRGFGGMVSFEVAGDGGAARRVAESTRYFLLAESLGGVESLIGYPPLMSHATMSEDERLARGIPPTLLRLSVGIEDADDLLEDLDQALARA